MARSTAGATSLGPGPSRIRRGGFTDAEDISRRSYQSGRPGAIASEYVIAIQNSFSEYDILLTIYI
jgi:hypothetical protein